MKKKKDLPGIIIGILSVLLTVAVIVLLISAVGRVEEDSSRKGLEQVEKAIRRAVTACYAEEGMYPPSLSYLEENYGLQIDDTRYEVHYSVFAENLAPDITVIEKR